MNLRRDNIVLGAIRRRKFTYAAVVIFLIVGAVALVNMNRDELPTFEIKQGLVAAVYPGATAEEVRDQVAKPLENELFSFAEVDRSTLKSVSKDGICYLYVDLTTPSSKKDEVWSKIRHRLSTLKLTLPAGVLAVVVLDDFSEHSAVLIAMESDDKGYMEMKKYAEELCTRLRRIPSLAKASIIDGPTEEIAVTMDSDRLTAYGVSPAGMMLRYQSASMSSSAGTFSTDFSNSPIHIVNPVTNEKEIEDYIVYSDDVGGSLRLRDVATVERRMKPDTPDVTYNGHTAIIVNVSMRNDNNVVKFGREVDRVLEEFTAGLPDSIRLSKISDKPEVVRVSILSFIRDLLISMLVVIFVMLMFFPMRSALIAGSGVPVCTAVTLSVMYATGMQLNTVTLAALIVVLGMIVDDSIITMDGYMVRLGKETDRTKAATGSARELFMPMFLATFAISAMFFPSKHIISGYLGDFIHSFPWIIAIALGTSLVYAVLVVPSLEIRFIDGTDIGKGPVSRAQNWFFRKMQAVYDKCEEFCFSHAALTMGMGVIAVVLGIVMFSKLNIQMMPKANRPVFAVEVIMDANSSISETRSRSDSVVSLLRADPRVKSVTAFVGQSAPRFHATYSPLLPGPDVAQLIVNTVSSAATVDILNEYEDKYEHLFPDAIVHFRQMDYQPGKSVEVILKGPDLEELRPLADTLRNFMYGMNDRIKMVQSDCDNFIAGVDVALDPEDAARLGVDKTMLSMSLKGLFDGSNIANLYEDGEKIPVNLYCSPASGYMDYNSLKSQFVPSLKPGAKVPLGQIAQIRPEWRPAQLVRVGGEESVTVSGNMKTGESQPEAMKIVDRYVKEHIEPNLPEGATVQYGGLSATNDMVFPQIAWSFLAAVAILFIFLLIHFRKVGISVLTMVLSMLCLFGASFGLWAFRMDFTMTAVLGLISLVGIIVRNGIIMFEYAEQLCAEGCGVREAAMLAGKRRMRPIFLTSCTTALGVLPMVLSGDLLWMPMGLVICFGTMLSIGLIVLIMPVSYWLAFKKQK